MGLVWVNLALVAFDEWSSYRGGPINRFDFIEYFNKMSNPFKTKPLSLFHPNICSL